MSATIKDVAKRANVSLSTVSLVINNKKNISPDTVNKVRKAIEELDYHPRHSARGLASKKSGNIGFILTEDHFSRAEPFYTKIFLGTEFQARQHNYYIILTTVKRNFSKKSIPRFLLERNVDGVILAGHVPDALITFINKNYDIPVVYIDYFPPKGQSCAVLIDNDEGARMAVEHLIDRGHQHIAFIGGEYSHPSIYSRYFGYTQALSRAGIQVNDKIVIKDEHNTGEENGYNATCTLLQTGEKFTAIFAGNDAMAFGCMQCLKRQNIPVPEKVALVGFDDVDVARQMEPRLTTIRINKEEMGAIAVKNMVDMISDDKNNFGKNIVPVELVVRDST